MKEHTTPGVIAELARRYTALPFFAIDDAVIADITEQCEGKIHLDNDDVCDIEADVLRNAFERRYEDLFALDFIQENYDKILARAKKYKYQYWRQIDDEYCERIGPVLDKIQKKD